MQAAGTFQAWHRRHRALSREAQPKAQPCARMLLTVAAASPDTVTASRTKISAKMPVPMTIRYNTPAILACRLGDGSVFQSVITAVLILFPPSRSYGIKSPSGQIG